MCKLQPTSIWMECARMKVRAAFACMLVLMMASVVFVTPARATSGPAAGGGDENGEIWITNQDVGQLFIVHPRAVLHGASKETLVPPTGSRSHLPTDSPDGGLAYAAEHGIGYL